VRAPETNHERREPPVSKEIAVVGSPEFTTGFRLAGVRTFESVPDEEKAEALDDAVERVLDDGDVGIVVVHDDDLDHLSRGVRRRFEASVDPATVTLGGGAGSSGLREKIQRAIGIDLMEEDT
jgi:V/A-type H+-transporting ATPase subunit F